MDKEGTARILMMNIHYETPSTSKSILKTLLKEVTKIPNLSHLVYLPPQALSILNLNFTKSETPENKSMGNSILKDPKMRVYYIFLSVKAIKKCSKGKHVYFINSS